jgi:FkbM family methyltransferase
MGPLTRLVRGALNRAAPQAPSEVAVASGPLAGVRMVLDLQSEKDLWLGTYEPELLEAIADLVGQGTTVYDVGANIGYTTIMLARCVGPRGRVLAFEPLPENQERLRLHVALNGLEGRVTLVPCAVSEQEGSASFLVHTSGGMGKVEGSHGRTEGYLRRITVETVDLDTFVYASGRTAPSLIKMDIEGGEVFAFSGMQRLLGQARPVVLVELHGPEARAAAVQALTAARYRLCRIARGYPPIREPDALAWKAYVAAFPEASHD